jgi:hypothetical protein
VKQKKILVLAIFLFIVVGLFFLSYVFLCIFGYYPQEEGIDYSRETLLVQRGEIVVDYIIKNDLSILWKYKMPQKFEFIKTKNMFINFEIITIDNESIGMFLSSFDYFDTRIRPQELIPPLVLAYPKSPKYLRAIITKYNDDWTSEEEWFFNIDISNINVVISGEEMKPGIFTRFVRQWVPETITLEDEQWFKADAYYLISSYRKPDQQEDEILKKLNISISPVNTSYAIFKVNKDTEIIHNEDGQLYLNSGGLFVEEMHLREILINSNSHDGFTLFVTPESRNTFKVKEGSVRKYQ